MVYTGILAKIIACTVQLLVQWASTEGPSVRYSYIGTTAEATTAYKSPQLILSLYSYISSQDKGLLIISQSQPGSQRYR